ncbi:urocanate hydratase [Reticulomyxa filosa]|uniref:Urocanate hydratase n=1 Tax=Reticulomyxa filosa TaxID=46433 RepID=X6MGB4_RETFI|nr:urocanate hydratase [Reticulomyxa filosa]|eukprot:ETO12442.1 urocanate hydratase [Reticulomyxa filosa]
MNYFTHRQKKRGFFNYTCRLDERTVLSIVRKKANNKQINKQIKTKALCYKCTAILSTSIPRRISIGICGRDEELWPYLHLQQETKQTKKHVTLMHKELLNSKKKKKRAQYHLTMQYLSILTEEQTLVMMSGHPQGLFPSRIEAPRVVITNGLTIPNYSTKDEFCIAFCVRVCVFDLFIGWVSLH